MLEPAGLGITVIDHHAGRERPAETLSGGETFYASLSLCLGLAEVVKMDKGGIELSTLFIDEGFGSLSNDKLTEVLDVLDKLRENGRIIGIITHLEDMKNQIPLRLEVIRSEFSSHGSGWKRLKKFGGKLILLEGIQCHHNLDTLFGQISIYPHKKSRLCPDKPRIFVLGRP